MTELKMRGTTTLEDYRAAGGNPHSAENQTVLRMLVDREVLHCVSQTVSMLAEQMSGDVSLIDEDALMGVMSNTTSHQDEIESLEEEITEVLDEIAELEDIRDNGDEHDAVESSIKLLECNAKLTGLTDKRDQLSEEEEEVHEALEHWAVTEYFGEKLKDRGEMVEDILDFTVWGRCCSGQAILLDSVVAAIAAEMEILEGQDNEWAAD